MYNYHVDEWDISTRTGNPMNFLLNQPVRTYSPVTLAPSQTNTTISLTLTEESKETVLLAGAVFRLYKADFINDTYVPLELNNETKYITDKNGNITIKEKLPYGAHCLIQEQVPDNYILSKTSYGFCIGGTVSLDGGTPKITPDDNAPTTFSKILSVFLSKLLYILLGMIIGIIISVLYFM